MPAFDPYRSAANTAAGPATRVFAVSPNDASDTPFVTTGLYVGEGGDVAVLDMATGAAVVFRNVPAGSGLPVRVARVLATGTTAADIVGLA